MIHIRTKGWDAPAIMLETPRNAEMRALVALKSDIALKAIGCRFERGLSQGVAVVVDGRGFGIWWHESGRYKFSNLAHQAPHYDVASVDDVVTRTQKLAITYFGNKPV